MTAKVGETEYSQLICLATQLEQLHATQTTQRRMADVYIRDLTSRECAFTARHASSHAWRHIERASSRLFGCRQEVRLYDLETNLRYLSKLVTAAARYQGEELNADNLTIPMRKIYSEVFSDDPRQALNSLVIRIQRLVNNLPLRDQEVPNMLLQPIRTTVEQIGAFPHTARSMVFPSSFGASIVHSEEFANAATGVRTRMVALAKRLEITDTFKRCEASDIHPLFTKLFSNYQSVEEGLEREINLVRAQFRDAAHIHKIEKLEYDIQAYTRGQLHNYYHAFFDTFGARIADGIQRARSLTSLIQLREDIGKEFMELIHIHTTIPFIHGRAEFMHCMNEVGKLFQDSLQPKTIELVQREILPKISSLSKELQAKTNEKELRQLLEDITKYLTCLKNLSEQLQKSLAQSVVRGAVDAALLLQTSIQLLTIAQQHTAQRLREVETEAQAHRSSQMRQEASGDGMKVLISDSSNTTVNVYNNNPKKLELGTEVVNSVVQEIVGLGPWVIFSVGMMCVTGGISLSSALIYGVGLLVAPFGAKVMLRHVVPSPLAPMIDPIVDIVARTILLGLGAKSMCEYFTKGATSTVTPGTNPSSTNQASETVLRTDEELMSSFGGSAPSTLESLTSSVTRCIGYLAAGIFLWGLTRSSQPQDYKVV